MKNSFVKKKTIHTFEKAVRIRVISDYTFPRIFCTDKRIDSALVFGEDLAVEAYKAKL